MLFDCRDSREYGVIGAECGFLNIDSRVSKKHIGSVRHCMHIGEDVYKDTLTRLTM
jgi:uncharacterized protein YerC